MTHFRYLLISLAFLGLARPVLAQTTDTRSNWPFCPGEFTIPPRPVVTDKLEPGDIEAEADKANMIEHGISHFEGHVEMTRDEQQATADVVDYSDPDSTAVLTGNVNYWDNDVYLHGDKANLDFNNGSGTLNDADYLLIGKRGRGKAKELYLDVGHESQGKNIDFTTCDPEMPGHFFSTNVWKLTASELTLNYDKERGYAHNVILKIKDIPVFYTPYLTFPLSKARKSGFLTPSMGTTSKGGFELRTPIYWNIAPNMDATFTPRLLTNRGVMGMGEYRYLFDKMHGNIDLEIMPSDHGHNNDTRGLVGLRHIQSLSDNSRLFVMFNRVTDQEYFQDFGAQLSSTSLRYLQSRADVNYNGSWWNVLGRVQDFQLTDKSIPASSKPYTRLPQILVNMTPFSGENRVNLSMQSEFVDFVRYDSGLGPNRVDGARLDIYPNISYPWHTASGYIDPQLGIRFTQYSLQDSAIFPSSPSRLLPIFSVDSGLELDRTLSLGNNSFVQTLEPRLYYLYVPHTNQDKLPVFDTGIFNPSYASLFRDDRFSGADRVGDANQVTLAVESRLFDHDSGRELGYFRIAEPVLLSPQDVLLQRQDQFGNFYTVGSRYTDTLGPVVTEAGANLYGDWHLRGEFQWNPNSGVTRKAVIWAQYLPGDGRVLNLGYRVRRAAAGELLLNPTDIEQTDISFRWPITPQWSVLGRWNYAVPQRKTLEMFGGVEYESCCWGVRVVARRFLSNLRGSYTTGVFLQVELKGLAGIGEGTESFLRQRIPGYEKTF